MSIDLKFVELTADVPRMFFIKFPSTYLTTYSRKLLKFSLNMGVSPSVQAAGMKVWRRPGMCFCKFALVVDRTWCGVCVCVFLTLNRSSTRRHPAHPVSVLILHPRKISSVVTGHDTEIMHRNAFDNAMSCPSTGYDRHNIHTSATEIHWKREKRNKQKQKQKQKTKNKNKNKNKKKTKTKKQKRYVVVVVHFFLVGQEKFTYDIRMNRCFIFLSQQREVSIIGWLR